jgi:sugar lactone lactonase YvrE
MVTALLGGSLAVLGSPVHAKETKPSVTVVARGLDNPRGLEFGPKGELYIAEAGTGGAAPCVKSPEGDKTRYGATGAVTRLWKGTQTRIITGLPSLAGQNGNGPSSAVGPHDVAVMKDGTVFAVVGLGANPRDRAKLGAAGPGFGRLIQIDPSGTWKNVADLSAHEAKHNPAGGPVDSNPYAVLAIPDGRVVADAGGNSLLKVTRDGKISTLAVFANRQVTAPKALKMPPGAQMPMEPVPDSVALGPDGAYYVGQLTGFPFAPSAAHIFRVVPGKAPTVFAEGFTNIISLTFDSKGNLYVLEMVKDGLMFAEQGGSMTGRLIKVTPDGLRTTVMTDGLVAPGGVAVGRDGALYVTNYSIFSGKGEVLRIAA